MKLNKVASLLLSFTVLTGCNTTLIPSSEEKTFQFENIPSKEFKYIKAPDGLIGVQVRDVRSHTINELKRLSSWGRCNLSLCSKSTVSGLADKWGTTASVNENTFNLNFINGELYDSTRFKKTTTSTSFQFDITETENEITLTLHSAKSAHLKPGRNAIGIPYFPLLNESKTKQRVESIFNSFTKPKITKKGSHRSTGEFNVPFDPASVITSFERLASRVNAQDSTIERKYKDSFTLKVDGKYAHVNLEVYLYRGKSKVAYSISYPYEVYDNGTHTSDSGKALSSIEKRVKEIANS